MRFAYGEKAVVVEGEDANWTKISIKRRGILRKSTLHLTAMPAGTALEQMKSGMLHVFSTIPTEKEDIRSQLLQRIHFFQSAIGFTWDGKLAGFEDAVFQSCKLLKGLIFWDGKQMLNQKGKLVMDFSGNSEVKELEIYANVDALPDLKTDESERGLDRKERVETWLRKMAVPINQHLPVLPEESEVELRNMDEVIDRALALTVVAVKGEGLEQGLVNQVCKDLGVEGKFSPAEETFVAKEEPEQQERVNFCWRYESLFVMLWALGHAQELGYPGNICDVAAMVEMIREAGGAAGLKAGAKLRSKFEVLDEADRIYRLHWVRK